MTRLLTLSLAPVLLLLLAPALLADRLHMKDGRTIEGRIVRETPARIVLETRFGEIEVDRTDVASIERGKTRKEEFDDRWKAARSADEFHALGLWCIEHKMRREAKRCMKRAVELDPDHEGAQTWLGNVRYKGEWMTPQERDRRRKADEEAAMRAKGLVRYQGRWVTPEEKTKLEQGLELVDGRWVTHAQAQRARGLEQFEGVWMPRHEAIARRHAREAEQAAGVNFELVITKNALVTGPCPVRTLQHVAQKLEQGRAWFDARYDLEPGLGLFGGRLAEFYLFDLDSAPYLATVPLFASKSETLPPGWAEAVSGTHGFLFWDPYPLSSARRWKRERSDLEGHCYHHWGHLLLNRLGYDGRLLPPWYDESFAALVEFQLHGRNAVFCRARETVGRGTSAEGAVFSFDPRVIREGRWREIVEAALAEARVPAFDRLARKSFSELSLLDVAVGMAILEWIDAQEGEASARFHAALRAAAPQPPLRVIEAARERLAAYDEAFRAATGLDARAADRAWQRWLRGE